MMKRDHKMDGELNMRRHYLKFLGAIFLTLLPGCSGIPFFSHFSSSDDPIERVGLEQQRRPAEAAPLPHDQIQSALKEGEITLGMSMEEVTELWGHPGLVDFAGDRPSLNQKWTYIQGLISQSELAPTRVVYFEKGRVSGWKITP